MKCLHSTVKSSIPIPFYRPDTEAQGAGVIVLGHTGRTGPESCKERKKESEVTQSCLTICDPMDCSLQGSSVHGILQAGILEWVATSFSTGSSRPRDRTWVSHIVGRCFSVWATREDSSLAWNYWIPFSVYSFFCLCPSLPPFVLSSLFLFSFLLSLAYILNKLF